MILMKWPTQAEAYAFYMPLKTVGVVCPWPIFIGGKPVAHIEIHEKCADSLRRVLANVWNDVGHDLAKIKALRYDQYDGSCNNRPIRGGHSPSMHSYCVAIDWDARDNQQHSLKHLFTNDSPLIKRFKEEGWVWGGDWSVADIDAMHVQAARVR
jgi:D-alanyl-D-alanine carboxypeptidase